jgi:hypothetical protein
LRNRYDAFWFPASIRNTIITPETEYVHLNFRDGMIVPEAKGDDVVTVRWPRLDIAAWQAVIEGLRDNRQRASVNRWGERLPKAIGQMRGLWADRDNPLRQSVVEGLASCTGHSVAMLDFALGLLDLVSIDELQRAASIQLPQAVRGEFVSPDGLTGRLRFFEEGKLGGLAGRVLRQVGGYGQRPWRLRPSLTELVLGFAAGNVPGTGLLLVLLGLAAAVGAGMPPPVIVVKNSRREPLFTPLVLSALELVDPLLVDTVAVTLWDYADPVLQAYLVGQADLVVAAAGDETIAEIGRAVEQVASQSGPIRYHRHGHKVSFSTIGRECLAMGGQEPASGDALLDAVALLAALDAALWNQQGCLSSRVHFVEVGRGEGYHSPQEYAQAVARSLRRLDGWLPKGVSRKRQIHNLFDKYQAIAAAGGTVQVLTEYDDDFLVALEERALTTDQFREVVNDCQGRAVVVIPVDDVLEVPRCYLGHLRPEHLQSMSVALGDADGPELDARLLAFAEALGEVGVTGIRTVGRGAFPQLAYSWDGLIPLDLTVERPRGYFAALEFDQPWAQVFETYQLVKRLFGLSESQESE